MCQVLKSCVKSSNRGQHDHSWLKSPPPISFRLYVLPRRATNMSRVSLGGDEAIPYSSVDLKRRSSRASGRAACYPRRHSCSETGRKGQVLTSELRGPRLPSQPKRTTTFCRSTRSGALEDNDQELGMQEALEVPVQAFELPALGLKLACPLLLLVDTFVLGLTATTSEQAALAITTLVFVPPMTALGFLEVSTTLVVAQAASATDDVEHYRNALRESLRVPYYFALVCGLLLFTVISATAPWGRPQLGRPAWASPSALLAAIPGPA
ncbi:hypothetical protein CYMTET_16826, partial [Cymbomonas tetramitiformis]